jgi:fatty-acyl-CoA synthase
MALPLNPLRCLERAVTVFGKKNAIVCHDKRFSYADFGDRCCRLASALRALGIERGDRVAYLSFNTHKLLEAYFGVVQAGAVVLPLNVRLSARELSAILNHAEPPVLFFENDFAPLVPVFHANCPSIRHFIALDDVTDTDMHYESILQQYGPAPLDPFAVKDDDTAELFYTSGSTGDPKGVMLSNRALYLHAIAVAAIYTHPESVVDLHTIPLFHANGWGHAHASTMLGVTQVMVRRFEPAAVLGLIERHKATDMCLVPTMGNALLNVPGADKFELSSMRQIVLGGAASSPPLIERLEKLFRCDVFGGYGLTETGPMISIAREKDGVPYSSDSERWSRRAMTGWSFPGVSMRVVDGNMNDVPQDMKAIGEIVTSCDWLMTGYYKDPEGTAAALTGPKGEPGGVPGRPVWLHTGDMAVWDEEGFVLIVDRKKEIIISGGENISSLEIEKVIYAHPGVLECAVVAAPDETWGEVPVAIVVRKQGEAMDESVLMTHIAQFLSKFKVPRRIEFVDGPLPKTGTGKIKKMELRDPYWKDHAKRVQG